MNDEWYTPEYAVVPIVKYLKPCSTIWCPFDKADSKFVKTFSKRGFSVIHTHIEDGIDFFDLCVPDVDYIISNPPFSVMDKVLEKLFLISKPFAMLCNVEKIFGSSKRFGVLRYNPFELIIMSPRVNYISRDGVRRNNPTFQSGYVCSGICQKQINFEEVERRIT
ncbi:MAG: sugar-phospahte nucleotidyltransferase [Clostridia bacterium]|nr:sugar-phospahte nucleotidyltransferase [Clostridia bacterium]